MLALRTTQQQYRYCMSYFSLSIGALLFLATLASANIGSKSVNGSGPLPKFPLVGITSDQFVQSSPLIIGLVCKDGVLLFALHSIFSEDNVESVLLQTDHIAEEFSENKPRDLPKSYRGPFRIHTLDSFGTTAMVCAGWRTDCQHLVQSIRSLDRREQVQFGEESPSEYASFLASRGSLMIAKWCTSERRRPMSCLGLLASGPSRGLWLVDATGSYRIRGMAVGNGSDRVNEAIRRTNWEEKESSEAKKELLQLLFPEPESECNRQADIKVPRGSCVEMALLETSGKTSQKMKRQLATIS